MVHTARASDGGIPWLVAGAVGWHVPLVSLALTTRLAIALQFTAGNDQKLSGGPGKKKAFAIALDLHYDYGEAGLKDVQFTTSIGSSFRSIVTSARVTGSTVRAHAVVRTHQNLAHTCNESAVASLTNTWPRLSRHLFPARVRYCPGDMLTPRHRTVRCLRVRTLPLSILLLCCCAVRAQVGVQRPAPQVCQKRGCCTSPLSFWRHRCDCSYRPSCSSRVLYEGVPKCVAHRTISLDLRAAHPCGFKSHFQVD